MTYELLVIGAGISGMAAALEAKACGAERVLIADYEERFGGFARSLFRTEEFAEEAEIMRKAERLPYDICLKNTVVGFFTGEEGEAHQISLQGPKGGMQIKAERVLLCSGSLEKPREAHRIPGSRPAGVMTPLMAVQMLERGYLPGRNVLLAGEGRIAGSTMKLFREEGIRIERLDPNWEVTGVVGDRRVTGVLLRNAATGEKSLRECDTLLFSRGRIPCTYYLKGGEIQRDARHAIVTDEWGRTNWERISAAGSCTSRGDDEHLTSSGHAVRAVRTLLDS
jgi:thioredoxin reductase